MREYIREKIRKKINSIIREKQGYIKQIKQYKH